LKHQYLREEVARIARQMISSGLVTGTSGNVSARTPEGDILITPSGLDYGQLEPGNVVLIDLEKNVLEGELEPSSETRMHTGICRARLAGEPILLSPEQVEEVATKVTDYGQAKPASADAE
jgi:L-fuculose-phosphate aldolase